MANTLEATRCNTRGCDHPDDEDLLTCESCSKRTCKPHSLNHGEYSLCNACGDKEYAAMKEFFNAVARLQHRPHSTASLVDAVTDLLSDLENWDVAK